MVGLIVVTPEPKPVYRGDDRASADRVGVERAETEARIQRLIDESVIDDSQARYIRSVLLS